MKISKVVAYGVEIPLVAEKRMISALGRHEVSPFVLVRVETDNGLHGAGEATITPRWSGETVWGTQALVERLFAPLVVGRDPADIEGLSHVLDRACHHNWFAKSAIEMACWDLVGKERGVPVYELLGGACRPRKVRCRFSMGAYDVDRARRRAGELIAEGFDTIKVKVGGNPTDDLARVRAVREAIGPDRQLTIDANCGWDAPTAIHCIRELDDANLTLVEQPTPDGDYGAIAAVKQAVRPPIMADDMCFNMVHARELVRQKACDLISVYPGKQGGIGRCRDLIEFAGRHGLPCSIGSNLEWDVATAAMAHLCVACPNLQVEKFPGDMLGPSYHEDRIVVDPLEIGGSYVTIPDKPGLGVEVDWGKVERMRMC
jgi:muconate cycloisomerase